MLHEFTPSTLILVFGAVPAALAFLLIFSITRRVWWTSILGWVVFALALSINVVFFVSILFYFLGPDYPAREGVKVFAYSFLTLALLAESVAIIFERYRGGRRTERKAK